MKPWTTISAVSLGIFGCLAGSWAQAAPPAMAPDEAFLLFLAEATEIEGQWVDPLTLAEVEDDVTAEAGMATVRGGSTESHEVRRGASNGGNPASQGGFEVVGEDDDPVDPADTDLGEGER